MIKTIASEDALTTAIFDTLVAQSGLPSLQVLNVNSPDGVDLSKLTTDDVYVSYLLSDSILLFELLRNNDEDNMSYTESNENIVKNTSYKVHITLYGNSSGELSNKLKARLLTSKVINDLYNLGVLLKEVGNIETINEFFNTKYWNRHDFDIYLACKYEYTQVSVENKTSENDEFEINTNNI